MKPSKNGKHGNYLPTKGQGVVSNVKNKITNLMIDKILAGFFAMFKTNSPKAFAFILLLVGALFYFFNDPETVKIITDTWGLPEWFPVIGKWVAFVYGLLKGVHTTEILNGPATPVPKK